ncbi:MAG: type II toxin-antitoxin system Phd/YefM family antitoxin [Acidobacteria bacterium]|nr:type II toxin-antitoxin system Phd/YefM family antitoxin [Acidobacteriota bacterium]MCH8266618.1 type II toxin-antitoxin system Phd/YefM family antitoxin [Acidobacteriota bacterium]
MTRLNASEVRSDFADILNRVAYGGERIVLHRRGKDVAALVPLEDFALLEKLEDNIDLKEARTALAEAKKKGTIPWKKIKADLNL